MITSNRGAPFPMLTLAGPIDVWLRQSVSYAISNLPIYAFQPRKSSFDFGDWVLVFPYFQLGFWKRQDKSGQSYFSSRIFFRNEDEMTNLLPRPRNEAAERPTDEKPTGLPAVAETPRGGLKAVDSRQLLVGYGAFLRKRFDLKEALFSQLKHLLLPALAEDFKQSIERMKLDHEDDQEFIEEALHLSFDLFPDLLSSSTVWPKFFSRLNKVKARTMSLDGKLGALLSELHQLRTSEGKGPLTNGHSRHLLEDFITGSAPLERIHPEEVYEFHFLRQPALGVQKCRLSRAVRDFLVENPVLGQRWLASLQKGFVPEEGYNGVTKMSVTERFTHKIKLVARGLNGHPRIGMNQDPDGTWVLEDIFDPNK
jgi:hypothetical protein